MPEQPNDRAPGASHAVPRWERTDSAESKERSDPMSDGKKPAGAEKKMVAGILGILLGAFGVHKFYLGYTKEGIIQIVVTVFTCGFGGLIGLVEGILYLVKSDEEFVATYIQGKKGWF
jgi:TM2 domain-containing membrane protein YozV